VNCHLLALNSFATGTDDVLANANAGTTDIKFSRCGFSVADGYICDLPLWTGNFDFIYCSSGTSVKMVLLITEAAHQTLKLIIVCLVMVPITLWLLMV